MNPKLEPIFKQLNALILGKQQLLIQIVTCVLARGHVLLEDVPGVGKTTLAHALAAVLGLNYQRVQFTNDMLPADLLGVSVFQPKTSEFIFHPGPVFNSFLLADEINRASPKLQSALLEAMEERQVSVDGKTYALPNPFLVVATQNPTEQLGTYPLPESQLDRFMMCLSIGYPAEKEEKQLYLSGGRRQFVPRLKAVCNGEILQQWQAEVAKVNLSATAADYVYRLVAATRNPGTFAIGLSPRAGLAVVQAAKAHAWVHGRAHVVPEDVKAVWVAVAAHRLQTLQSQTRSSTLLTEMLDYVAVV
ncbi:MAG: AAA family ATPase [Snodgrassella sp.]|jgi:MoxR-like ATPase|uniref:AAA family ATPase n=1 Tax=Snodgrassella alvi TaxID=1196083 RepID=A0A2N9XQ19_9NEIS|nr:MULTISPECIES: AAA family ATPase [Snodgrassella]MCO6506770.1 AAA family ATPase [Snodgrassella sp.]MCO6513894.1 AAA family ATPase [Snodgrassella sp.]MCO6516614.1 AAA family ATPase [Snodgrassella sp.]MCO6518169.1 AAA family ATPase [Snodgrassella sp.]MCO6519853.1 AAA family ATPase [Snodgrassella sp.]